MPEKRRKSRVRRSSARPTISKELARTWILTVINPIIVGVRQQKPWLTRKNWTWRYVSRRFEHLWQLEHYVDFLYRDNYIVFRSRYPDAARSIDGHDVALSSLAAACTEAFEALLVSPSFAAALQEATAAARAKGISIEAAAGAVPPTDWPRLVAEYLINNISTLPEYYTTSTFWREVGAILQASKHSADLQNHFAKIDSAGAAVQNSADEVEDKLLSIRHAYMQRFGLPPVPLPHEPEGSSR